MATEPTPSEQVKTATIAPAAAPTSGVTAVVENPVKPAPEIDFDSLTEAQQDAILYGKGITVSVPAAEAPAAPVVTPAVEKTPETPVATPAPAAPEAPAAAPVETPESKEFRPRLTELPEIDREAILLRKDLMQKGQDIPLAECVARVEAKYNIKPAAPADQQPTAVEKLEQEIADLNAELEQTQEGVLATPELLKKAALLGQKQAALETTLNRQIEETQIAEQRGRQAWQNARAAARDQAIAEYPDIVNPESPLAKKVDEMVKARLRDNHPSLEATDAPLDIARIAAAELGVPRKAHIQSAPPISSQPSQMPQTRVPVASGASRTTPPTQRQSEAELLAKIDTMSVKDIDALLYGDKKPLAVLA